MNRLALRLAGRELRAGVRGLRLLVACLALGVAAIAGVESLGESVREGLRADGRRLLGGDIDLRLSHFPADSEKTAFIKQGAAGHSEIVAMRAMARAGEGRALVELKAVDRAYPLVGALELDPPLDDPFAKWSAVADRGLLVRLGIKVGDTVQVGEGAFVVRAAIKSEPDRMASVFNFGPRFMISKKALESTGLVKPGSQIKYHYRRTHAPGTDGAAWREALEEKFPDAGWRVRTPDKAAPGVDRFVERMSLFLGFVGLTALLIGGVGVSNAVASYLGGKTASVATFKCLGASSRLAFSVYFIQVMVLSLSGTLLGLVLGALVPFAAAIIAPDLPVTPKGGVYWGALGKAAAFGLLTAAAFSLRPLARAGKVPAANLFRYAVAPLPRAARRADVMAGLGMAGLAALTLATATDKGFAAWFVGGTAGTLLALALGAKGVMAWARRTHARHAGLRLALANLHRPGAATQGVVLSLGVGLTVLVGVALVEANLGRQIDERLPDQAPSFFFLDVQSDQVGGFDELVASLPGATGFQRVPSLRGRIVAIDGTPVGKVRVHSSSEWAIRGDRALTYAVDKPEDADITAGKWWPADYSGPPRISLDAGLARGFEVGVGDSLTLNVLGREIEAVIASLREIDWRSLRFDFAIIFAPGTLEGAPHTHIAAVRVAPDQEDALIRAVTDAFPNVSAIRVREALDAARAILDGVGRAVRGVTVLALFAGALVLAGAMAAGRRQRIRDAVVLKVLGATRGRILAAYLIEYGVLGLAAGILSAGAGTAIGWAVVVHLMRLEWTFRPETVALTVVFCVIATLIAGFAGAWLALGRKAAPILRNE